MTQLKNPASDEPYPNPASANVENIVNCIIVGRNPGVYVDEGEAVRLDTLSIPKSRVLKFATVEEANAAFLDHLSRGNVVKVALTHDRTTLNTVDVAGIPGLNPDLIPQDLEKYRCIYVGRAPGIYPKSYDVTSNVENIPKASNEVYETYEKARQAFLPMLAIGKVVKVEYSITHRILTPQDFA